MRPLDRATRPALAVGALTMTSLSVSAFALAASDSQNALPMSVSDRHLSYGQRTVVRGDVGPEQAGRAIVLEHANRGGDWRAVRTSTVDERGRYRFALRPRRSGVIRVRFDDAAQPRASASATAQTAEGPRESTPRSVAVAASLRLRRTGAHVRAGRRATVRGTLRSAERRRLVRLQRLKDGRWRTVARDRTDGKGRFTLRYRPGGAGSIRVRVAFSGDTANAGAARRTRINSYRVSNASWYGPGLYGNRTACGGTLGPQTLGVAHKTLPCGTEVTFRYKGRSVRVRVIDRGPYVRGREWDLTGATAKRLRFHGHGAVWSTR